MSEQSGPPAIGRRRFLKWSAISGLIAAVPGLACSGGDEEVFAGGTTSQSSSTTAPPSTTTEATTTTAPTTSSTAAAAETTTTTAAAPPSPGAAAGLGPDELAFNVTYEMSSGGKQLNPYLAIWIENEDGEVLRTIELWSQQSKKGPRWLPDLKRWFVVDEKRLSNGGADVIDTLSQATRQPGSYSFVWDGLDQDGAPVADKTVVAHVETAREQGPYSLIRAEVVRGTGEELALADDGELSKASVIVGV